MNTAEPQSFEIIFNKRDELLILDPAQDLQNQEIIATCEIVREMNEVFCSSQDLPSFTYTRG